MGAKTSIVRITYNDLVNSFSANPRDVKTHTISNSKPIWFHVSTQNGVLYAYKSKKSSDCKISKLRKLKPEEFEFMYELHRQRECGASVARVAQSYTQNASYWFGVLYAVEHGE